MTSSPRPSKSAFPKSSTVLLAIVVLCCAAALSAQTFVSFDAPDAGHGPGQGTIAICLNQNGIIAGYYIDSAGLQHGFMKSGSGGFAEFDGNVEGTLVTAMNGSAQIIGYGSRTVGGQTHDHGFVHSPSGGLIPVNVPGGLDTQPTGINDAGMVAGSFSDSQNVWHGFTRDSSGNYTTFDAPDSATQSGLGTFVNGINANGMVTGRYFDSTQQLVHGFIRDQFGNFTSFDAGSNGTVGWAINLSGEVTGWYFDNTGSGTHGFVRDSAGDITSFDPSGSQGTFGNSINDASSVVGEWITGQRRGLGFQRNPSGGIISFSASTPDTTIAASINNAGHFTGYYIDAAGVSHGFVK